MDKTEQIKTYMEKLGLTEKEALQLWEDDHNEEMLPEVKELTEKAKHIKRYEQSGKPRKKANKERKVDNTKKAILTEIKTLLEGMGATVTKVQTETKIMFTFEQSDYTVQLTKHRQKK